MAEYAAFFYGTLMIPGILYRVIYGTRNPEPWQQALTTIKPALLEGYRRHKVEEAQYPAIIACQGASVRGAICTGLTEGDVWRLDVFEGDDYYKTKVKVKVLKDEIGFTGLLDESRLNEYVVEEREVNVYVWKDAEKYRLSEQEWDFEDFRVNKMKKWTGEERLDNGDYEDTGFADVRRAIDVQQAIKDVEQVAGPRGDRRAHKVPEIANGTEVA